MTPCALASRTRHSRARCISLASVGKATAFGCTVVSTITRVKSDGFAAPVRVAASRLGELVLAHALPPARQRRTLERQRVAEELFAAEQLIIGFLAAALAQHLVGEVVHADPNLPSAAYEIFTDDDYAEGHMST